MRICVKNIAKVKNFKKKKLGTNGLINQVVIINFSSVLSFRRRPIRAGQRLNKMEKVIILVMLHIMKMI